MTSFYTEKELKEIGFKFIGKNTQISRNAKFYGVSRISIGDYSRIDDFCVLSAGEGGIDIGRYVHIAVFSSLQGKANIRMEDFSGISSKSSIYSSNGDYLGEHLSNPNVPEKYRYEESAPVILEKHALVGTGSVIMQGVTMKEGSVVGAFSFVKDDCEDFWIYAGNPAKVLKERSMKILDIEKQIK